ncbi:CDP-diacylglycerol--serine O-phosphatidyltransferase [bacterium]|nr:CDP-diacylglycerol--serine O-phosphatidyltransferase [bacterium]
MKKRVSKEQSAQPVRRFSMIRDFHFADLFTLANGFCGVAAIFQAMSFTATGDRRELYTAVGIIPLAIVFDFLDGRIARWRHKASPMGREMDSLADVISFGAAPAAIAYAIGLQSVLDQIILIYFAACSISRLARYNITAEQLAESPQGKVKYFEGTPVPLNIIPLAITLFAFSHGDLYPVRILGMELHLISLLYLLFGSTMISKTLRIPKP